jgi:hypothetical protein
MSDLPPIDAVLLTNDHDGDNLDVAGRELLYRVGTVITTVPGAKGRVDGPARGAADAARDGPGADGGEPDTKALGALAMYGHPDRVHR